VDRFPDSGGMNHGVQHAIDNMRLQAEAGGGPSAPMTRGSGLKAPQPAEGCATPEQLAMLKKLAAQVSAEAAEDLEDVLDHSPKGVLMDVYRRIEARLQTRLHGKNAAVVA
jgi:hypothetical protein